MWLGTIILEKTNQNWEKDLNRLFEYTRMPVKILDHKGQTVASIGLQEGKKSPEYWTEYE